MSKFNFYNIQVLPVSSGIKEIGGEGYKGIFDKVNKNRLNSIKKRSIHYMAFKLPANMYLSFFNMHFEENLVYGDLIKFDQPNVIYDTYTGKAIQNLPPGVSSQRELFKFVFDVDKHIFSFESKAGSPRPAVLISALHHFLSKILQEDFKNYNLKISLIADSDSVEDVFRNSDYYKSIKLEISYSNATKFVREMLQIEEELKENGITSKIVIEKTSEKSGQILQPTNETKLLLALAKTLGNATIRYFDKRFGKIKTFNFRENPYSKQLRKSKKENDLDFVLRVNQAADVAVDQANARIES